ncbi:Plasmid stabilization system protein ParE [Tangfeifania diversioriginum]|uniref:Plasmid stabilization system protein ParE n=1 Tax=Tangfeifania diversioriginum TaxID=1168035 RepID=A0A1M6DPE3_9BACT|nr:Plasmid stabilization system protein ParE [Tangfeifania diversioriginum]
MEFKKKIIWSPEAKEDLENILDYLMFRWGIAITSRFLFHTEKMVTQIAINPKQYPIFSFKKRIRRCVLTKQNTIYYRVKNERVEIVRIFDTRQNPNNLRILFETKE